MSGVRPIVPNMLIVLSTEKLLFIAIKRSKGGRAIPEQIKWIKELKCNGVIAVEVHGFEVAKKIINQL